jgi:hypothetical protein
MDSETAFHATLAILCGHELNAVIRHKWRLPPDLRALPDTLGWAVFALAYVPVFAMLLRWLFSPSVRCRHRTRTAFAGLAVVHAWLHHLFRGPDDELDARSSRLFVLGAALSGVVYLLSDTDHRHHQ